MAAFFQLLRDRILNRAFIVLTRQPVDNANEEDKSSESELSENDDDKIFPESTDSETGTGNIRINVQSEEITSHSSEVQKTENVSENSQDQNQKNCSKPSLPAENVSTNMPVSNAVEVDLKLYQSEMSYRNSLETRCQSVLNLALCLVQDSPDLDFPDCLAVLKHVSDSHRFPNLAVCHALLLHSFTKMSMSFEDLALLEESILSLTESLRKENVKSRPKLFRIAALLECHRESTLKLCDEFFSENYLDVHEIDILTICCSTLGRLSLLIKQYDNELGATYVYKKSTIKYILGMTGKSTQEIVSEFLNASNRKLITPSVSCHRIKQCLQILEHALSVNPELSNCASLHHESFSLPHCLTRLLGWSASCVFPGKYRSEEEINSDIYFKFHLSTLISILKILSVLTFNPNMYDAYPNVKGLMEKILICALKAYFESKNDHFDIQVLCLEMLINLYIKHQKTFVMLCLKKFKISESEEVLAIEALIKMLYDNLEKIKKVKETAPYPSNNSETAGTNGSSTEKPRADGNANSEEVLQAASRDMEHSTIVSFICVLIVFFMRAKQNFEEFILERLTSEALKEATTVSQKFLEFASFTGGMPVTGILILTQTINKLQAIQSS